jgi:hypothetical protein
MGHTNGETGLDTVRRAQGKRPGTEVYEHIHVITKMKSKTEMK